MSSMETPYEVSDEEEEEEEEEQVVPEQGARSARQRLSFASGSSSSSPSASQKKRSTKDKKMKNKRKKSSSATASAAEKKKKKKRKSSPADDHGSEAKPSRSAVSLAALTKKFLFHVDASPAGEPLDLNGIAKAMGVSKRRLYDITNVLEGVSLLARSGKNDYRWVGKSRSTGVENEADEEENVDEDDEDEDEQEAESHHSEATQLRQARAQELATENLIRSALQKEDAELDVQLRKVSEELLALGQDSVCSEMAYVLYGDLRSIFPNNVLLAIMAPEGTLLEVADPDYGQPEGKRLYQFRLDNPEGNPIYATLVSDENSSLAEREVCMTTPLRPTSEPGPVIDESPTVISESPPAYPELFETDYPALLSSPVSATKYDFSLSHGLGSLNSMHLDFF